MATALAELFGDFLSTIIFLAVFGVTGDIILATGLAVGTAVMQFAWMRARGHAINLMQWLSIGLVLGLGGATLITHDSRFVMFKPSIGHFAVGAVMLRRGWMGRYLPRPARDNLDPAAIDAGGYAWAALMFALGLINIAIALTGDMRLWGFYITFVAVGAKVLAGLVNYVVLRTLVARSLRAKAQAARPAAPLADKPPAHEAL
ncbi:inner membrane-spanning protein YciB [Chelatococcus reniformis]|uniref:Intracellular septation protein n=1 Tax=Chelatococcus reniformis TaxID=1494448 RepID=A0A916U2I1_9HYPH|nr:septation protein IspZ [Chelatococcus reniformis]GGC57906.1 intracellular septation protein [Chelatococcus reniformis]